MKEIRKYLLNKADCLLAFLLALVGVSCSEHELMYGSPYAKFDIDLEVTDEDGKPVSGQEVILRHTDKYGYDTEGTYYREPEKKVTDKNGRVMQSYPNMWAQGIRFVVKNPVDESLQPDSVKADIQQLEKGHDWYQGWFKASGQLKLKKKK